MATTTSCSSESIDEFHTPPRDFTPSQALLPPLIPRGFYEELVILELLQRILGHLKHNVPHRPDIRVELSQWAVFRNELAWMCDRETGGKTSSAIAVEATVNGPKYWLSSKKDRGQKALPHLRQILERLKDLTHLPREHHRAIFDSILKTSLRFSAEKFTNYYRSLWRSIREVKDLPWGAETSPKARLCTDLDAALMECTRIMSTNEDEARLQLCTFAFKYVKSDSFNEVYEEHYNSLPTKTKAHWYNICHDLGRLGSWVRAVKILVCYSREHPHVLENFQVAFEKAPRGEVVAFDPETTLESVFESIFPEQSSRVNEILERLRSAMALNNFKIDSAFSTIINRRNFRPCCHAEVVLLDHFYRNDLLFFGGDAYIGSSKPPCYCCNLYFELHRSNITTRPTRGNAWPKWLLPPHRSEDGRFQRSAEDEDILRVMGRKVRRDILELIESDLPRQMRLKDSTTGLWTAPTLNIPEGDRY